MNAVFACVGVAGGAVCRRVKTVTCKRKACVPEREFLRLLPGTTWLPGTAFESLVSSAWSFLSITQSFCMTCACLGRRDKFGEHEYYSELRVHKDKCIH